MCSTMKLPKWLVMLIGILAIAGGLEHFLVGIADWSLVSMIAGLFGGASSTLEMWIKVLAGLSGVGAGMVYAGWLKIKGY